MGTFQETAWLRTTCEMYEPLMSVDKIWDDLKKI